ncbi:hypothetical protein [Paenibacillus brasilensis]|uniref:hypothetical protein n=1 Tax=Paenibacillus brasilensis TaxID=128574 RepID=UPI001AD67059|nr:hypothetical protein [Paenibacillus brasilensis]
MDGSFLRSLLPPDFLIVNRLKGENPGVKANATASSERFHPLRCCPPPIGLFYGVGVVKEKHPLKYSKDLKMQLPYYSKPELERALHL